MKTLIDALVLAMLGFGTVAGAYYGKDKLLHEVRERALTKAHEGLGSMESIARKLTARK